MFVSIVRVPKADANGIFRAISGALDDLNVDVKHKIVCFTADGATVNTGHLSGVISKMREAWNPSIVMIKCLMHRVELAVKEVFTNDPHYKSFQSVLTTLFTLYHRSPLMRAGLEETFACLTPPATPIMPSRVGGTRFVGHTERAIQKLWQGYKAYILHLTQVRTKNNWWIMHKIWLMWYISHKYRAQVIPTIYKCYQIFLIKLQIWLKKINTSSLHLTLLSNQTSLLSP